MDCTTIAVFANWVGDKEEVYDAFLAATPLQADKGQAARLKQCWREANAIVEAAIARTGQGIQNEDLDQPLDDTFQRNLETQFRTTYNWARLDNRRTGSDVLLGRISREFQKRTPSMYAVSRVKSLARALKSSSAKRQRLGDRFALDYFDDYADGTDEADTLAGWLRNLEILTNTWALAGCFNVQWAGSPVKYAHWEQTSLYLYEFRTRMEAEALKYFPGPVLDFAIQTEEAFRGAAIQLARDDPPVPWGLALLTALDKSSQIWSDKKEVLGHKINRASASASSDAWVDPNAAAWGKPAKPKSKPGPPPQLASVKGKGKKGDGKKGKAKGDGNDGGDRRKWVKNNYSASGRWICHPWNSPGGCRSPCQDGGLHVCDATLANGYGCEGNHTKANHHVSRDGAVKFTR